MREVERSIGRPERGVRAVPALTLVAALVGACAGASTPALSATPEPTAPAATAITSAAPSATSPGALAPSVLVDPDLLDLLPAELDGAPFVEAPDAEALATSDAALARVAERLAVGYLAPEGTTEWAIASIVALRPIPFTEAAERSWRDTYDAEACSELGGAAGHAETELGGRTVHIATCGGLIIHHVRLTTPSVLIAITSTRGGGYGQRVLEALGP